jgi:hypothetical protein
MLYDGGGRCCDLAERCGKKPELRLEVFEEHGKVWFSLEKWRLLVFD